ncbi:methylmalonyl-CoA mutase family protein [Nocardioides sp.]|uniref:methylmalonyl-CoA mutase family protein n=1 Tax=Nocardioides sp. TaxID=35761 RepID=UPI003D134CAB
MTDATEELRLVSDEDVHSQADWEKAAAAVLRKSGRLSDADPDAAVWDRLSVDSLAGIEVAPLGIASMLDDLAASGAPGAAPFTRGRLAHRPEHGWDIRPSYVGAQAAETNEAVLTDLQNGATSLWLTLTDGGLHHTGIAGALDGVLLDLAPVVLDAPGDPIRAAQALVELIAESGSAPADGTNLGADPIGARVRGTSQTTTDDLVAVARLACDAGTLGIVVDATAVHDLGASEWLELGYSMAVGATYLRLLTATGFSLEQAMGLIEFRYAATDDQFVTIAKLRAARRLWHRVGHLSGATHAPGQRQHAVTSRPMMAKYDPWVNMLRTTVAAFAAGVGGADAVTVLPFDAALGLPDAFSRRIARNTSSLLIAEAHVAKVADPAGGSYAVEKMTDDLAHSGWGALDSIETEGGIEAAIASGWLAGILGDNRGARRTRIATRRQPITGVSEFPNLSEVLPERAPYPPGTLEVARYGADFETMRDQPTGEVFLATLGPIAAHTARATFAANLLAAGGIAVAAAGATSGVDDVVAAYAGQAVVCLAGTDAAYAEWGADLVAALRSAGARHVILAGNPGGIEVDDSCTLRMDAVAFLTRTRTILNEGALS